MTEETSTNRLEDSSCMTCHSIGKLFFDELKTKDQNKTILVDGTSGKRLTYGELLDLTLKLAVNLRNLGVSKGDVITIISQNNWQFVVTIIAGFYLGVKLNLLNHDYTSGEIKHFFSICKPKAIFCTSKTIGNVLNLRQAYGNPDVVIFDDHNNIDNVHKFSNLISTVNTDEFQPAEVMTKQQVCLILTSSGTTGYPKGVMLSQSNFRSTIEYLRDPNFLNFRDGESTLAFLPIFHMFGIVACIGAVLSDTLVVTLDKFAPNVFLSLIQEHKITQLFTVPPILLFLAKSPMLEKYDLTSVKELYCGAAPVSNRVQQMVKERLGIKSVQQIYGMTETAGAITTSPRDSIKKEGSVGKVITNFHTKILDIKSRKSLGPNEVGELCVKGDGVMLGYCCNPEATERAFEKDGFLKTGDLGYYDTDGYFYIVDRLKEIIKYKGFQVSPAELESHLNNHPGIKEAGVVGIPDERAGELPLAFVVKQPDKNITEEDIIQYIAENVSIQKQLHGGVRFLDEIPKNASGKIIRKKLRELLV